MHYLLSFLLGRRPQGSGVAPFQVPPLPHPVHPQILDRATVFASTSTSLACRPWPRCTGLGCPTQLCPWPLVTFLPWASLFPRGIVRATQRRTSPRGKLSTLEGEAVPPSWPGLLCADPGSPLVTSTQTFCVPENLAKQMGLQGSEEFTGEPGAPGSCGHLL